MEELSRSSDAATLGEFSASLSLLDPQGIFASRQLCSFFPLPVSPALVYKKMLVKTTLPIRPHHINEDI